MFKPTDFTSPHLNRRLFAKQEKEKLDELIKNGDILGYESKYIDENGSIVLNMDGSRVTEQLIITLRSGKKLRIDTFCSGCSENTTLFLTL